MSRLSFWGVNLKVRCLELKLKYPRRKITHGNGRNSWFVDGLPTNFTWRILPTFRWLKKSGRAKQRAMNESLPKASRGQKPGALGAVGTHPCPSHLQRVTRPWDLPEMVELGTVNGSLNPIGFSVKCFIFYGYPLVCTPKWNLDGPMDIHLQVQLDDFELPSQSSILYKACIIIVQFQNILTTRRLRVSQMPSPCFLHVLLKLFLFNLLPQPSTVLSNLLLHHLKLRLTFQNSGVVSQNKYGHSAPTTRLVWPVARYRGNF